MDADRMLLTDALEVAIESSHQLIKYKMITKILVVANVISTIAIIVMAFGG